MNNLVNFLKQGDIFYQFTPTQLELVANLCQEVVLNAGDIIFQENSSSKELYVIAQGEVDILINRGATGESDKKETAVARLRRGQSFGEVALVDEGLRSASARATQKDTRLLIIQREKLIMLCETYPQLGYRLMYNLAADLAMKIRNTDLRIRESFYTNQPIKSKLKLNEHVIPVKASGQRARRRTSVEAISCFSEEIAVIFAKSLDKNETSCPSERHKPDFAKALIKKNRTALDL